MWTTEYILSQVCVIIATIIFALSYFTKNKKTVLILGCVSIIFYILEYLLLGAIIVVGVNVLSLARTIWFYINDERGKKKDYPSLIISSIAFVIVSIITYAHPMDIIVLFASILFTYAVWQQNIFVYRILSIISSLCWLVYNVYCFTIMGIILEFVLLVIKTISSIEYMVTTKKNNKAEG